MTEHNLLGEKKINIAIYYAKAIAIFCVICAHCGAIPNDSSWFVTESSVILGKLGSLGVSCFLFLSGALFSLKKKPLSAMLKEKICKLGIPWIISGTAVYLYVALRHYPLSFFEWFKYIIGYGSYCYYLTILFLCFIVFSIPFLQNGYSQVICFLFTILSVTVWPEKGVLTPYLDFFNWMGYFAIGMTIGQYRGKFENLIRKIFPYRWIVYLLFLVFQQLFGASYFGGLKPVSVLIGAFTIMLISIRIANLKRIEQLEKIGKNSLFIYLWHMPFAGIIACLFQIEILINFVLVRPIIILVIMFVIMLVLDKIDKCIYKIIGYSK